ncbi:LysR family transcriptional regulator [Vibrio genomosp. F10]|uniref:LysR family transcriptional regulator n=1 Tax=Vibrio genomosp. F10 TaxID=723171 RepID=UPI0002F88A84|nr:LysR family transcriptional regulator [Vibrio genomosp. F10]OEF04968.1 transcriptional regulator [Vibrio genomosp. F10 str. 9ZB36]
MHTGNDRFDLNTLTIFKNVVELNSLSKAAEKLGINASTVTRKLNELETFYGVKLLVRTTRVLTLTSEGKTFYSHCLRVDDILSRSEGEIMNNQIEPTGILKVVMPVDLGNLLMLEPIFQFTSKFPKVVLDLEFSNRQVDVIEEGVDVWITVGEVQNPNLIVRKLSESVRKLMASPSYLAQHPKIESLKDIVAPHKRIENNISFKFEHDDLLKGLPKSIAINSSFAVYKSCLAGLGLAFISTKLAEEHHRDGQLIYILEDELTSKTSIYMLYAERHLKPWRTQCFLDFMLNYFETK